jgi:hypothetical protein
MHFQRFAFDGAVLHLRNHMRPFSVQDLDVGHVFLYCDDADVIRIDTGNVGQRTYEIDGAQFFLLAAVEIDFGDVLVQFPLRARLMTGRSCSFFSKAAL